MNNDPNKCAQCAKAMANGFKSRCVLIEEDYQRYFKANKKVARENVELNANIRRIIQARDKERAKVKRLVEAVRKWRKRAGELEGFIDNTADLFVSAAKNKEQITYVTPYGIAIRLAIVGVGRVVSTEG